jgi:lipoprotein NlpI
MKNPIITLILLISTSSIAQNKVDKRVVDDACSCVNKINVNLSVKAKNDSIHSCISMANVKVQILDDLTGKLKKQTIAGSKDSVSVIIVEKDINLIQETLLKDCVFMRELLMTDNEKLENSVTKDTKALDFHQKGSEYFNQEKYELAVVEFKKALKIDPNFAFAWDDLGLSYRKLNKYDEAIVCYKKSLELDPKGRTPLMNMAVAYQLSKDNKSAIKTYKNYIKIHSEDPEGYYGIARIYRFEKEYEDALESAFKAVEMYDKIKSPYVQDAVNVIREVVKDLKEEKKIKIFNTFAEKHGIEKIKE